MSLTAPWIKQIDVALASLNHSLQSPLTIPFPREELVDHLRTLFNQNEIRLEISERGWVLPSEQFQGMTQERLSLKILFTPLSAPIYFVTTAQDLKLLMSDLLGGKEASAPFLEHSTMMGFYHYLGLEVLSTIDKSGFAQNLAPRQEEAGDGFEEEILQGPSYVIDVFAKGSSLSFAGRVFVSESFRDQWRAHFETLPKPSLTKEEREKIAVELSVEVGSTRLSFEEWKGVQAGDLVILDHSTIEIPSGKGRLILSMNGQKLFRGKLVAEGIKILEYPLYEEVGESMDDQLENEEETDLYGDVAESDEGEEKQEPTSLEERITAEKIPILLTVEAGRIRMTAEELMQLTPGHIIDLKVRPEQSVDLVINGKRVGKGELVKVGEVLGVRILKL